MSAVRLPWKEIAILGVGGVVFLSGWLFVTVHLETRALARLKSELQNLQPQRAKLEQVQATLRALQNRSSVLKALKSPQVQWAPRLNLLSDALVAQLWFTRLRYGGNPGPAVAGARSATATSESILLLQGSALVAEEAKGSPVSHFLQKLKEHPEFSHWFRGLELKSVEHRQVGEEEVSDFVIALSPAQG